MSGSKYQKPIDIVTSIIERFDYQYPNFLSELNNLDKKLLNKNPRHTFSKVDCISVINKNKNKYVNNFTESDCVLTLYNWYKSKIIYSIKNPIYMDNISLNKNIINKFPYTSIYLDMSFPETSYCGCFCTITRERVDYSLQYFLLLTMVEYKEEIDKYVMEPFLLTIKDNITTYNAFYDASRIFDIPGDFEQKQLDMKACSYAVCNILRIINSYENKHKIIKTSSVNRDVTEIHSKYSKSKEFNITYSNKYQYTTNKLTHNNGSPKSPHTRRSHERHIKVKDKNGNIVGEKVIIVRESHIHENEEGISSIKVID